MQSFPFKRRPSSWLAAGAFTVLGLQLTACRVGPNYRVPAAPVPPAYTGTTTAPSSTEAASIGAGDWWKVFDDTELNSLEQQADTANTDIRIAVTHVDQAAAMTSYARSYLFPTVSAQPNVDRTREAQDRPNNGATSGLASTYNDFQLPLVLNYEIDAWGRVRRTLEAARATQ